MFSLSQKSYIYYVGPPRAIINSLWFSPILTCPVLPRASLGAAGDHGRSSPADQRRVAQGAVPPPLDERQATAGVLRQ